MKLIVGLGNPGKEYERTRHNAGFMALDMLHSTWSGSHWSHRPTLRSWISTVTPHATDIDDRILLAKPDTFMNLSGYAVQALLRYYHLDLHDLIVVYDDLDLPLGELRTTGTSSGGHNGMKSVLQTLGTTHIQRIRIGIDRPKAPISSATYVLEPFTDQEHRVIHQSLSTIPSLATRLFLDHTEVLT